MKTITTLAIILGLFSCDATNLQIDRHSELDLALTSYSVNDTINFCTVCDSLRYWQGGIQGVEVSDSTKIYPMAECHANQSFDLIWKPKGNIIKAKASLGDNLFAYYDLAAKENFKDFDCYAFVVPKTKPNPHNGGCYCDDQGEYDYIFPSNVTVYKKIDKGWLTLATKKIASFKELGRFKLNTIFNNYNQESKDLQH